MNRSDLGLTWAAGNRTLKTYQFQIDTKIAELYQGCDCDPDFSVETPKCDGEFAEQIHQVAQKIRKAAKRRMVWACPQPDDYSNVSFFFGTKSSVVARLIAAITKQAKQEEKTRFLETITQPKLAAYGRRFGGKKTKFSSITYTRNDGLKLSFTGVGAAEDFYNEGPRVQLFRVSSTPAYKITHKQYFKTNKEIEQFLKTLPPDKSSS